MDLPGVGHVLGSRARPDLTPDLTPDPNPDLKRVRNAPRSSVSRIVRVDFILWAVLEKIPAGKFPQDFTGIGIISRFRANIVPVVSPNQFPKKSRYPIPIRIYSSGNPDFAFPPKRCPWKCLFSRGFPFPCRKIPWSYRFPKSLAL